MTSLVGDPQLLLLLGNHYIPNMTSSIFPIKSFIPLWWPLVPAPCPPPPPPFEHSLFQRGCLTLSRLLEASAPKAGGPLLEKVTIFHVRWNQRSGRSISGAPPLKITIAHALCYEPPNKSPSTSTKYWSFESRKSWSSAPGGNLLLSVAIFTIFDNLISLMFLLSKTLN